MNGDPLAVLSSLSRDVDGVVDRVRELLALLPPDSPAYAYAVEVVGAANVLQSHLQARVVPAVQALEPPALPPGDPTLN